MGSLMRCVGAWAVVLGALFVVTRSATAAELVVATDGALTKIQDAINAAADGDTVRVMNGVYKEAIDFKGKKIRVYGDAGPTECVIDAAGTPKSPVVTFKTGETAESVLEGFTLTGGTGAPLTIPATPLGGGGIFIESSQPTVRGCIVTRNDTNKGGGILVHGIGAGGLIENCAILENTARPRIGAAGGGIAITMSGTNPDVLTLRGCRIAGNMASAIGALGGGIHIVSSNTKAKAVIKDCVVQDNTIGVLVGGSLGFSGEGGGLYLDAVVFELEGGEIKGNRSANGAGFVLYNQGPASVMKTVKVVRNITPLGGGGGGGFIPNGSNTRMTLTDVEFLQNQAGDFGGGAFLIEAGAPNFERCTFLGNTSADDGGAIRLATSAAKSVMNACRFSKNTAGVNGQGGAIYVSSTAATMVTYSNCIFEQNSAGAGGGAVYNKAPSKATNKFFHCVFHANTTTTGVGGVQFDPTTAAGLIQNSILWDNKPSDTTVDQAAKISYSDIKLPAAFPATAKGVVSVDPLFVSVAPDAPNFHLQATSPLIDKGIAPVDVDGKLVTKDAEGAERSQDGNADGTAAPDMGAYEVKSNGPVEPRFIRADVNEDLKIDVSDAVVVLSYQFLAGDKPKCFDAADADDSGLIDLSDPIFILNYLFLAGQAPPAPGVTCGPDGTTNDQLDLCAATTCTG